LVSWFKKHVTAVDIRSVLLLLTALSILMVLPDRMVDPYGLFNPYKTWFMTLIIATISFVGYLAMRIFGSRNGLLVTGLAGGLISSTAVAISLSSLSHEHTEQSRSFVAGIAMASTLMFFRILLEVYVVDHDLTSLAASPLLMAAVAGGGYAIYLYATSSLVSIDVTQSAYMHHPLQISTSLKFGLLFGLIYGMIKLISNHYGETGVYLVSALSGVTDVDAITLSLASMASDTTIPSAVAVIGISLASMVNTVIKTGIVIYNGGRDTMVHIVIYMSISLTAMATGLYLTL